MRWPSALWNSPLWSLKPSEAARHGHDHSGRSFCDYTPQASRKRRRKPHSARPDGSSPRIMRGRILLRSDRGALPFSTPCPTAPTMIYRLASTSSGAMRQSRRFPAWPTALLYGLAGKFKSGASGRRQAGIQDQIAFSNPPLNTFPPLPCRIEYHRYRYALPVATALLRHVCACIYGAVECG
jgi:hypothetical protein